MPFQSVPDTAIIEIRCTNQGIPVENTWYAKFPAQPTAEELDDLAEAVGDAVVTNMFPLFPNSVIGQEIYCKGLTDNVDAQGSSAIIAAEVGSSAGTPLPNNVSFAVRRTSGLTGRSARGRIFWLGLTTAFLGTNENIIAAGDANAMANACIAVDAAIALAGAQSVIVSRFNDKVKRSVGVTYPVVTWSWKDLRVDSHRERLS